MRLDRAGIPLLGLTHLAYLLEKLDPEHRRGNDLLAEHEQWKTSRTKKDFFEWLNRKEIVTKNKLPRMVYRTQDPARKNILMECKEGQLYRNKALVDTLNDQGKRPGYAAFTFSADNQLFLTSHHVMSDVHASLEGGRRVACAGMIKVQKGKITELTNFSGHYHPDLKNLWYAVKHLPANVFSSEASIVYTKQRFPRIAKWFSESRYALLRGIGGKLSRMTINTRMTRPEFILFAEKQIETTEGKFIYQRDKKNNRYENSLYESYLSKTIIQNDASWRPTLLKINQWIYHKIASDRDNQTMLNALMSALQKYSSKKIDRDNVMEITKQFLLDSKSLAPTVLFHGDYFERIHASIKGEQAYDTLATYSKVRSDDLFSAENRGVDATSTWRRTFERIRHPFYQSSTLGILSDAESPAELSDYFENEPSPKKPAKRFYQLQGERLSHAAAQRHRDAKTHRTAPFGQEIIERDVTIISGASGTTSKIMPHLIESMRITPDEMKTYLMVRGATLAAYGHHSIYEVMVLARKLGFPISYDHTFYHQQFMTPAFRNSPDYKNFLAAYPDIIKSHLPKLSAENVKSHAIYLKVKNQIAHHEIKETKETKSRQNQALYDEIKTFDRSTLRKQTVYYASLGRHWTLPRTHGYAVVGTPGTAHKPGFGSVYQARRILSHTSYSVSPALIAAVQRSTLLKKETKAAVGRFKGQHFKSTELFLRELYTYLAKKLGFDTHAKETKEHILTQVADTDNSELRELIDLNIDSNNPDIVILPGKTNGAGALRDLKAFETDAKALTLKAQSQIDPMAVREVYQQQLLYRHYMEEKAGIGDSTAMDIRMHHDMLDKKSQPHLPIIFHGLPDKDNMHTANCNKVAATLLQAAENLTASREKRPPRTIKPASLWSYGSSQRMFFWNPLQPSLKSKVLSLINKCDLGNLTHEKQDLADNACNILHIIASLNPHTKQEALKDILNPTKALGQIFHTKASGAWLTPGFDRGYLLEARKMLQAMTQHAVRSSDLLRLQCTRFEI